MNFIELQNRNEEKLRKFLEFFELSLCKRCWAGTYNDESRPYHTHGGVLEILDGIKTDRRIIDAWTEDLEHGFLHSLMVLYFSYCLHPQQDMLWDTTFQFNMRRPSRSRLKMGDRFVASCLFHDYMRFMNKEPHDRKLEELSKNFMPVTYRHSNPLPEDESHPLIGGDRLELMRYPDHKEWCRMSVLQPYIDLYGGIELIDHFFNHIRPVFYRIFRGRYEVWISHVLEINMNPMYNLSSNKGVTYFPKTHWKAQDNGYMDHVDDDTERYISVNIGKLPIQKCLSHTNMKFSARGMITVSDLNSFGASVRCAPASTAGRDHPFLFRLDPIQLENWTFAYDDINQINQFETDKFIGVSEDIFNMVFRLSEDFLNKLIALSSFK